MKWLSTISVITGLMTVFPQYSNAYVLSTNSAGTPLRWASPVNPVFYANWQGSDGLSYSQIFTAFTNAFQRWKYTGSASIDFEYYQGNSVNSWGYDGHNAIFFASQSSQKMGASTLGVTYVFSSSGTIVETDVEFNDESFSFTTTPTDSSQFGSGSQVFLENVATHEFGHAYGLGHSGVLQSSMVFLENRAQAKPSCDDITGIGAAYPLTSYSSARGSIVGAIDLGGTGIFGAHVLAISKTRGTVVTGAISQPNGSFTITKLEPGDYYLMVEPFETVAPISSLCGGTASGCFYGTVNSSTVCSGSTPFKRGFIESVSGTPLKITVVANTSTNIGGKSVSCTAMSNPWGTAVDSTGTAPTLLSTNAGSEVSAAVRGVLPLTANSNQYFKLSNVDGNISVNVISYGLYSPVDPRVTILDSSGNTVASGVVATANVFANSSNYTNYDASAVLNNASAGDYYVRVTTNVNLTPTYRQYPAGTVGYGGSNPLIDLVGYYLLSVTVNDSTSLVPNNSSPTLTNNARCESLDSFPVYQDRGPGSLPPNTSSSSSSAASDSGSVASSVKSGACGTIVSVGAGSKSNHRPGPDALFSMWGVAVLLFAARVIQRLASRAIAH